MALKLVSGPVAAAVSLDDAKAHLVVEHDEHDSLIAIYIAACQGFVDGPAGYLGRALIDQTWDLVLPRFPGAHHHRHGFALDRFHDHHLKDHRPHEIEIPLAPLIEVIEVVYLDTSGAEQPLDAALYHVGDDNDPLLPGRIVLAEGASWPVTARQPGAVRVRFRAGYLDQTSSPPADAVPFPIKAAILLHVGDLYKNRETTLDVRSVAQLPWAAQQLLAPHRLYLSLA